MRTCFRSAVPSGEIRRQRLSDWFWGKKIPLIARILTVADVFDALTSNRPYRRPWSVAETEEYMLGGCGVHFDFGRYCGVPAVVSAVSGGGTMVSPFGTGRHAGVVVKNNTNVLRPVVRIYGEGAGEEYRPRQ